MEEVISAAQNHYYHKDLRKFAEYFYDKNFTFKLFSKNVQIFIDDFQKVNEMNNKLEMELADFILSEKQWKEDLKGRLIC